MNKLGKIFIIVGILLITTSGSLLVYNSYKEYVAGIKSQETLDIIKTNLEDTNKTIINTQKVSNEIKEMKTININGHDYIGTLTIPTLNLELPIMSDYDYNKLNIAPCRYYGNIYTNDLIICAHSYKNLFRYIKDLTKGDLLIFTDMSGNKHLYEVQVVEVLPPEDVKEMIESEFDLTLFTCTDANQDRITVRFNKIME